MRELRRYMRGAWGIASGRTNTGEWVAWGRLGRTEASNPVDEPAPTWFQFGADREEALARLMRELNS